MKPAINRYAFLSVLLALTVNSPLEGQVLRGRILVAGDTLGVDGVNVALVDQDEHPLLQILSDSEGYFQIPVSAPGRYGLNLSRIGFRPFLVEVVVGENEMVEVEIRMDAEAIPLDPLVVTARRVIRMGTLDEFHDRMERNQRRGVGYFITRDEIENAPTANTTFLLATVPTLYLEPAGLSGWALRMRDKGEYCTPDYYLDGLPTTWERLPPMEDIEGVEIYRDFEHVEGYWPSPCGAVFMWRASDWGQPFSWTRFFIAGGFITIAVALALIL